MIVVSTKDPIGIETEGEYKRFIASFLSHNLQSQVHGFSIGMVVIPPLGKAQPHKHETAQESWYVIEGRAIAVIGDEQKEVGEGDIIYGPENVEHYFINLDDKKNFKALLILSPGGDERNVTDVLAQGKGVHQSF